MRRPETWVEYRPMTAVLFDPTETRTTAHWVNGHRLTRFWRRIR